MTGPKHESVDHPQVCLKINWQPSFMLFRSLVELIRHARKHATAELRGKFDCVSQRTYEVIPAGCLEQNLTIPAIIIGPLVVN